MDNTRVVSFRIHVSEKEDLKRIADDRGTNVNAMLAAMVRSRIEEIATAEDWERE